MAGKIKKIIIIGILLFIAYVLISCTVPFLKHKTVSQETKKSFDVQQIYSDREGTERVLSLDDNEKALEWRLKVIETAKKDIIITTFDWGNDDSGKDMMASLLNAAKKGVHVRIVVDGINGFLKIKQSNYFKALVNNENVEAKFYNPINLAKPWSINLRMHDKYLIADDQVYILGGRNTNNLFLGDYKGGKNIDRDLLVYETRTENLPEDNSLVQLKKYFNNIWSLSSNQDISYKKGNKKVESADSNLSERYKKLKEKYPDAFTKVNYEKETIATNKVTLLTNPYKPDNKEPVLWYELKEIMLSAKTSIIQTPYIICSDAMYKDLKELHDKNKNISVIANAVESGANPWGCTDYVNEKENILDTGISMYEMIGKHSNHTKAIVVDDRITIIGSYNLDMRSTYLDTEMMLVVDSKELNKHVTEMMEDYKSQSKRIYQDGLEVKGDKFKEKELDKKMEVLQKILKYVIRPFRHLL